MTTRSRTGRRRAARRAWSASSTPSTRGGMRPSGGSDDERRAQVRGQVVSVVPPEVVVGALDVAPGAAVPPVGVAVLERGVPERRGFLRGENRLVAQRRRALQGCQHPEVPDAAQVRRAPRGAGSGRGGGGADGRGGVEQGQVDGVRHRLVAGVGRVQPVAAVQVPPEPRRLLGVAHRGVEVDDPVVGAARADPRVESLPLGLARLRPVEGALERQEGGTVDGQPARVRPLDHRPVPRDQVVDGRPRIVERHPDVVGRLEDDHVGRPRLQQHVAVEPRQAARPEQRVRVRRLAGVGGPGTTGAAEDAEARVVA